MQTIFLLVTAILILYVHGAWLDRSNTEIVCMIFVLTALLSPATQEIVPGVTGFLISILTAGIIALSAGRK